MLNISFRKMPHMLKNISGMCFIVFSSLGLSTHVTSEGNGPHTSAGLDWDVKNRNDQ